jgi:hypothetical protein
MRGHLIAKLEDKPEDVPDTNRCGCGWLRPRFVDLRAADKTLPLRPGEKWFLLFDCPQCGARWDCAYESVS